MHICWWPRFLTMAAVNFPLLLVYLHAFPFLEVHPDPAQQLMKNKQALGLAFGSFQLSFSLPDVDRGPLLQDELVGRGGGHEKMSSFLF